MAKAVADSSVDNQGGFASDSDSISGFSHMHDSGTGGVSSSSQQNKAIKLKIYLERIAGKLPHLPQPGLSGRRPQPMHLPLSRPLHRFQQRNPDSTSRLLQHRPRQRHQGRNYSYKPYSFV